MDSEEWGEICIGCAGGGHSTMTLPVAAEAAPAGSVAIKVAVSGLMGGHSGLTIGEYRCVLPVAKARRQVGSGTLGSIAM